jgi:hypothetical protein
MPTKKKTSPESEAVVKAAAPAAEKKKTVRSKSPAATHKSPARKAAAPKGVKSAPPAAGALPAFSVDAYREEIEREAYFLFVNRGAQHGHEHEDWLRAIEIVKARQTQRAA